MAKMERVLLSHRGGEGRPHPERRWTMTDKLEKEILERICAVCVDRRDDGSCGLEPDLRCSIEQHLPRLLRALENVSSSRLGEYTERLRQNICAECEERGPGDSCEVRERVDCHLDRYLMLVVEAIEDLRSREDADVMASAS